MTSTDELLDNSKAYAKGFQKGNLPLPPAKRVAVVACMDARLDPARILGLEEGDAHVIRNAGGVVTDSEIRSLAISQHLLGTEEVIVIHHTDCATLKITDEALASKLEDETGERPPWDLPAFPDVESSVRHALGRIEDSPHVPRDGSVRGFVYEIETGNLREVERGEQAEHPLHPLS